MIINGTQVFVLNGKEINTFMRYDIELVHKGTVDAIAGRELDLNSIDIGGEGYYKVREIVGQYGNVIEPIIAINSTKRATTVVVDNE